MVSEWIFTGYFYSNTGYILTALIIEKATHYSFQTEIMNRTIRPADLTNTFYSLPDMDTAMSLGFT